MKNVKRLINATYNDIAQMNGRNLKTSILKSEGRVIMAQHLLFDSVGLVRGITNAEINKAFGADLILLNTFNFDKPEKNLGMQGLTVSELKERVKVPVGIYLGCPSKDSNEDEQLYDKNGMLATKAHIQMCQNLGIDFIILGGNPGTGTSLDDVIKATKKVREICGSDMLIFAGKWEDGVNEKVLGDPLATYDSKEKIRRLIDAGADVIDLPAPGTRSGISVKDIKELVYFAHTYKEGTLAMSFLNSSVEGADVNTIREVALKIKETGADIVAIGDGGFSGCPIPENIMQLSITIKGKPYTYFRMASN
ncbi:DUF7916 family protein [Ligilactobacillus pobuzihii]|uniref:PEP phosphonomutase family protein n=1 Tax=Ligilactobacillus pobuzihii TaxID=449659 RepID=A0A0R2LDB8_9LACO|nr:hypothetical protein [Ligilactobacillus pobuzihii]KRK08937.1 PEP phosphonomutase family protein [Ligilactobacillus pobuzihii E100301 = KCTC 13174]KRN99811.1 PEP phosphonomutase family protein [Ligilactobacillus pobuzihii]GEN49229.1 hypothetical protein LPO01_20210 [Ligilactobacillus pobuzihii]